MTWFILGVLVGALAAIWWCDRNWRRYRDKADLHDRFISVFYDRYLRARFWLRRWGEAGLISRLPEQPPSLNSFRYSLHLLPEHSASSFLGLLECTRPVHELDEILEHKGSKVPLHRYVAYSQAVGLEGVSEYLPTFERRIADDQTELPPATKPIDLSSFGDIDAEEARKTREENLAEARQQMDKDEASLNRYLRLLLSGEMTVLSEREIQDQITQVRSDLAEIVSARNEDRIPDLEDYEIFQEDWDDDDDDDLDDPDREPYDRDDSGGTGSKS